MEISIELRELQPFLNERGQLKNWPAKKKRKVLALWYLAGTDGNGKSLFRSGNQYAAG